MPPHLKKSVNQAHFENDTSEQHLERELELIGLEAPDETQVNTVTQQASQQNSEKSKPICHLSPLQKTRKRSHQLKQKKTKSGITRIVPKTKTLSMVVLKRTLTLAIRFQTIPTGTKQLIRETDDVDMPSHPVIIVVELSTPQGIVTLEQTQLTAASPE